MTDYTKLHTALDNFKGQVFNGGLAQWRDNGYFRREGGLLKDLAANLPDADQSKVTYVQALLVNAWHAVDNLDLALFNEPDMDDFDDSGAFDEDFSGWESNLDDLYGDLDRMDATFYEKANEAALDYCLACLDALS